MDMTTAEKRRYSVSYVLTVDGQEQDRADREEPLQFVSGLGEVIPGFERQVTALERGESFDFVLEPEEGYGCYEPERVFDVPLEAFTVGGQLQQDLLEPGTQVPMLLRNGGHIMGTVREVGDSTVRMDFNHELAGKQLHFAGKVEAIDTLTPDELDKLLANHRCCHGDGCYDDACGCAHHGHQEGECCGQCH